MNLGNFKDSIGIPLCDGTIIVTPEIRIEADTIIDATGRNIVLSGNNINSVFWIWEEKKLDLIDLTLTEGAVFGAVRNLGGTVSLNNCVISRSTSMSGGGIRNENWMNTYVGTMSLTNTVVSDNNAYTANSNAVGGGINNDGIMTLTNCTVTRNSATTVSGHAMAGAIHNGSENSSLPGTGTMTFINTTVSDNTALDYGGIWNAGELTLLNSTVAGNRATDGDAGAIFNNNNGTVTLRESTLSDNTATIRGGAIYAYGGTITIEDSTLSNNLSDDMAGGIMASVGATLTISNSTISGNSCHSRGGGIMTNGLETSTIIINSTLSGNSASQGGGIYNYSPLTLNHVTFSGNSADEGSNLWVVNHLRGATQMTSTLIANGLTSSNCFCSGDLSLYLTDGGYNLADDDSCSLTNPTSMPNIDPLLDPVLADNGGFSETHALMEGSPAIDAIPDGANGCGDSILSDQRAIVRPQGDGCDIGAYEFADACESDFDEDQDVDGSDLASLAIGPFNEDDLAVFVLAFGKIIHCL